MFNAEFYTKENGEKPARDFIESFGEKVHAKFTRKAIQGKLPGE